MKLESKNLVWGVPEWLSFINENYVHLEFGFPDWLDFLQLSGPEDHHWADQLLDRHFLHSYKRKVMIADFFTAETEIARTEISELFANLEADGIRFTLVRRGFFPDTFAVVMWQPEDEAVAREFLERQAHQSPFVRHND